jgi:hypothetical protein
VVPDAQNILLYRAKVNGAEMGKKKAPQSIDHAGLVVFDGCLGRFVAGELLASVSHHIGFEAFQQNSNDSVRKIFLHLTEQEGQSEVGIFPHLLCAPMPCQTL